MGIGVWSMVAILYQTFLCIIISWLTLSCRLEPISSELHEVTLIKLLYLYDPEACGRIHFYNFTTKTSMLNRKTTQLLSTTVVWPISNSIASSFRSKIQLWLALHLLWTLLSIINSTQRNRPFTFYVTLIPFTVTGVVLLGVDLIFAGLFLANAKSTGTETDILRFINMKSGSVRSVNTTLNVTVLEEDTTWISVLLAYASIRGVVQWILNFWIVKDSYFEGLASYHRIQYQITRSKLCSKNSQYTHHIQM